MATDGGCVDCDYDACCSSFAFSLFSSSCSVLFLISCLCNVNRDGDICVRTEQRVTEIIAKDVKMNVCWSSE